MATQFESIKKTDNSHLSFPKAEVLNDIAAIQQRLYDLNRALSLGNLVHSNNQNLF